MIKTAPDHRTKWLSQFALIVECGVFPSVYGVLGNEQRRAARFEVRHELKGALGEVLPSASVPSCSRSRSAHRLDRGVLEERGLRGAAQGLQRTRLRAASGDLAQQPFSAVFHRLFNSYQI